MEEVVDENDADDGDKAADSGSDVGDSDDADGADGNETHDHEHSNDNNYFTTMTLVAAQDHRGSYHHETNTGTVLLSGP